MTEPTTESEVPSEEQKKSRRTALIIIWANVLLITGLMMYVLWFWHAPHATGQQWVFRLGWTFFFLFGVHAIISKTFAE